MARTTAIPDNQARQTLLSFEPSDFAVTEAGARIIMIRRSAMVDPLTILQIRICPCDRCLTSVPIAIIPFGCIMQSVAVICVRNRKDSTCGDERK